jgi:hypothetical protein
LKHGIPLGSGAAKKEIEMTELTKIAEPQQQHSGIRTSELIAAVAIVVLLIAVQGMFIAKHTVTLNAAAAPAAFGIIAP